MGTYINHIDRSLGIPEKKQDEFKERIKILFQSGGMMDFQKQILLGKEIFTISPTDFRGNYIDFTYNYYEDRQWENAGFSLKNFDVYSNKVGWSYFNWVMSAAHILQGLYSDGDFLVIENEPIIYDEKQYISWINSLFNEHFPWKNWDRFKVACIVREYMGENFNNDYHVLDITAKDFEEINSYEGMMSCLEMKILNNGSTWIDKYINEDGNSDLVIYLIKSMREKLQLFKKESLKDEDEQIEDLLKGINKVMKEEDIFLNKDNSNKNYENIIFRSYLFTSPVILLKCMSELYQKDFWKLFDRVENFHRITDKTSNQSLPAHKLSELLDISDDDMIFLWKQDSKIQFSKELKLWFTELKRIFNEKLKEKNIIENPLLWIMDLLVFATENYVRIFAFESFFRESIENINNQSYLILWKIFEDMCHDEKMLKNGSVIFFNNDPKSKKLKDDWDFLDRNEIMNNSRVILKRYMALVANRELRKLVFGF